MIHNVDPQLYQWDVGRIVNVSDSNATHIHFANPGDSKAPIIEIVGGSAKIPDYLLQTGKAIIAYAVLDGVTLESKSFPVRKRERPENYVYEDDQRNYIYELIADAEKAAADASEAAEKANQAAKSWVLMGDVRGENIVISDALDQSFAGFRIFGKTTQDGTPTPTAPADLVSVGASGSITVNVTGASKSRSVTVSTPNGLPGVPVRSGGNYTDSNSQQWICDEIDLARGVYVKRIGTYTNDGNTSTWGINQKNDTTIVFQTQTPCRPIGSVKQLFNMQDFEWSISLASPQNAGAIGTSGILYCICSITDFPDVAAFKAYLNKSPLKCVYPIATPIETPLTEEELAAYVALRTYKDSTTVSNDAGAWMDLAYTMDAKKYIDSLSTPAARMASVVLPASKWVGSGSLYSQVVSIAGITENSQVNLTPSVEQLSIFYDKDITFVTENDGGVVTIYVIGQKPQNDYTIPANIVEVSA